MRCGAKNSSLSSWQEERFLDWVMQDQGDYCCCEVRLYRADPKERKGYYRCPICNDEWAVQCPDSVLEYDPSDVEYENYVDRRLEAGGNN